MRFLCLAYGSEAGWNALSEAEKEEMLAHDAVIRGRGNLMSAVSTDVTTVKNWGGNLEVVEAPFSVPALPLAGFSVIEADSIDEVIALVKDTPCPCANGAIEIRPFWEFDSD